MLFIGLFDYYSKVGIHTINFKTFENIAAIIAAISILGNVSIRLPRIRNMGDSSLYGISYFLIMCVIGLMTSYFNGSVHTATFFGLYLDMFKILCGVLIFVLLATNLKSFKEILNGEYTRKNQLICLIIFVIVSLFASYAHIDSDGTPANIRCLVVMISGLFGGPFVGIPVGIISGAYRFTLGGVTAIPCALSTVISGVIGSLFFIWNDKKFPKTIEALILMFLFTGFEMLLVVLLTPPDISFPFVRNIYLLMLFASVTGMLLFTIVIKESKHKMNPEPSAEELKIKEIETELEKHDAENEKLRKEIEDLRNEIRELKKE